MSDIIAKGDLNENGPYGRYLTKALFWEYRREGLEPSFTLKEKDFEYEGKVYPSMRRIFLDYKDPTEYSFAKDVLGSWDHWKKLKEALFFKDALAEWKEELDIIISSEAFKSMYKTATTEGSKGTAAARFLAKREWKTPSESLDKKRKDIQDEKIDKNVLSHIRSLSLVKT